MKCNKRLAQFLRMLVSVVLIIGMMPSNNTMVFATDGISYGGGGSSVVASVTLTLNPPASTVFDGNPKEATVSGYPEGVTGLPAKPVPEYTGTGYSGYSSTAPINVGNYTARITWGDATATVDFSITAANGAVSVVHPTANSLTYNGTPQALVTAGSTSTGTIDYRLGDIGVWGGHSLSNRSWHLQSLL